MEDFCIQLTNENTHKVKETLRKIVQFDGDGGFIWSTGAYYGIRNGKLFGKIEVFGKEFSFNEFISKFLVNNYSIF